MRFGQICEAHDVLSNGKFLNINLFLRLNITVSNSFASIVENKAIYDIYGEYGLKEGCVTPEGKRIGGGYFMRMDAERYFEAKL